MNKKLMVGALAVALTGGGIIGAALLPSTNAAASDVAAPASTSPVQKAQTQQDNDKEVNDDGAQDKQDNDKEVSDDGAQAASITKQQSIDAALKQTAGTVSDVQLETENGVTAYTVTIKDATGTQHEVTVDATTGKVIPEND
ncbi:PepSY domain-containing protein [Paenibacillus xylanivorans]|uniref:PepSY domain-containing protein n=1 Tax=Paenibacillus xylanivorans TaxID=1705561 RepID=A0A0M9BNG5_9BACL|nr:PepSY domain-containing protein [Paenibacillus xylanivorans]KOY15046.1 hypothetical protein AMS66_17455 [Paenibacillus xylanivorans]